MKKITFKQLVKDRAQGIELSSSQIDSLMQLQNPSVADNSSSSSKYYKINAVAMAIVMIISIGIFFSLPKTSVVEKIAAEVSHQYLTLKPLEVKANKLTDLDNYFTLLDFKLVSTEIMRNSDWTLLGARYCSIQGNTAAQLRLKNNKTDAIETLYQAPYYQEQFAAVPILENNQTPVEIFTQGIGTKICVEKGVLFVLTGSNPAN